MTWLAEPGSLVSSLTWDNQSSAVKTPEVEVLVVGHGFKLVVVATNCARSIRRTNPGMPIRLVTNAPKAWAEPLRRKFDLLEFRDELEANNRAAKLAAFNWSSTERVLYLDADAEVCGDLLPAFRMLDAATVLLRPFDLPSRFRT